MATAGFRLMLGIEKLYFVAFVGWRRAARPTIYVDGGEIKLSEIIVC